MARRANLQVLSFIEAPTRWPERWRQRIRLGEASLRRREKEGYEEKENDGFYTKP
ncbi:hypothetical protein COLO4_35576 [Corchorus olitorius]|uniref:Uncharacterized protein n=1 Tax=Corchorus olitorius TaxID=93759 RepID=A0A1R3GF40_9ROSI|nr:hypothetical protein COLO4_35576 [Corchorus olitorius]